MADEKTPQALEANDPANTSVGPSFNAIKEKFSTQRIPLAQDFEDLIKIADSGRRAAGRSPDQSPPGPGAGLMFEGDKLAMKANPGAGIKVDANGVGVNVGEGLEAKGEQLAVKANSAAGIKVDGSGIGVNVGEGLKINESNQLTLSPGVLFVGMVVMYSGDIGKLKGTGWYVCNGENGTPDLRNRFILAVGPDRKGQKSESVTDEHGKYSAVTKESTGEGRLEVKVEDTRLTVAQMPEHRHLTLTIRDKEKLDRDDKIYQQAYAREGYSERHDIDWLSKFDEVVTITGDRMVAPYTTKEGGGQAHGHNVTGAFSGIPHTHTVEVEPPYYAMVFIMYTGA